MKELQTCASIQLIGEYGVYANGKMVQLMLPLRSTMRVTPFNTTCIEDAAKSDSMIKIKAAQSEKVYSVSQEKSQEERLAKRIGTVAKWLKANVGLHSGNIEFLTDFPLGLGIEDNLVFLAQCCLGPEYTFQDIADRVMECEWKHRPTCSFAYLLPAIKLASEDTCRNNIFLLERELPKFDSWDEFGLKNSPENIKPIWRWIEKATALQLNGLLPGIEGNTGVVFDIAVFARPKAALLEQLHPSVKKAVATLPLTGRSRSMLCNLANLTDQAFSLLHELPREIEKNDKKSFLNLWWELGRILTCYHFTMSSMQRTDPLSDKFIIEATQQTNVVGAKTTASGLGGTVLILYFAQRGQEQNILNQIENLAEKYGYTCLSEAVLRKFCAKL